MRAGARPRSVTSVLVEEDADNVTVTWRSVNLSRGRDVEHFGYGLHYFDPTGNGGKRLASDSASLRPPESSTIQAPCKRTMGQTRLPLRTAPFVVRYDDASLGIAEVRTIAAHAHVSGNDVQDDPAELTRTSMKRRATGLRSVWGTRAGRGEWAPRYNDQRVVLTVFSTVLSGHRASQKVLLPAFIVRMLPRFRPQWRTAPIVSHDGRLCHQSHSYEKRVAHCFAFWVVASAAGRPTPGLRPLPFTVDPGSDTHQDQQDLWLLRRHCSLHTSLQFKSQVRQAARKSRLAAAPWEMEG